MIGLTGQDRLHHALLTSALAPGLAAGLASGDSTPWTGFLRTLKAELRADAAWLTLTTLHATQGFGDTAPDLGAASLRAGRVYDESELSLPTPARVLRISAERGLEAALGVQSRTPFRAADTATLSRLDALLASVLTVAMHHDAQRYAPQQGPLGWALHVSTRAQVLGAPAGFDTVLNRHPDVSIKGDTLTLRDPVDHATVTAALADASRAVSVMTPAFTLSVERGLRPASLTQPAHRRVWLRPAPRARALPPDALPQAWGLDPSEMKLALQLADGLSLAQAAEANGWTVETARSYSKRLYARTGTRGQGDLIRVIHGGAWWGIQKT